MEEREEADERRVWETVELGRWGRGGRLVAVAEAGREGLRKMGSSAVAAEEEGGRCCSEEEVLGTSSGLTTVLLPSNFPSRGNALSPDLVSVAAVVGGDFISDV